MRYGVYSLELITQSDWVDYRICVDYRWLFCLHVFLFKSDCKLVILVQKIKCRGIKVVNLYINIFKIKLYTYLNAIVMA